MKLVVSACLLGCRCRYDGRAKPNPAVLALSEGLELIPLCPEQLGGLPTPRPASERVGERVINERGEDVSSAYTRGAEEALALAQLMHCSLALLKERSPSCGCGEIYDGSFSKALIPGDGVTAALFRENGIAVFGESHLQELMAYIDKQAGG